MEDGPLDILITNFLKSIILVEAHLKMSELLEVSAGGTLSKKTPDLFMKCQGVIAIKLNMRLQSSPFRIQQPNAIPQLCHLQDISIRQAHPCPSLV
jgi:hypothetical protein